MPVIKGSVADDGALVKVTLGWSFPSVLRLRQAYRPIPAPVPAVALIDSGADITCVDTALIQQLAMPVSGFTLANIPALPGSDATSVYDASLTILHPSGRRHTHLVLGEVKVIEAKLNVLGYEILLGRDILAHSLFLYNGKASRFTLKY